MIDRPEWMKDESLKEIPIEKLEFLQSVFAEGQGKSQKEMLAFLLPKLNLAKQKKLAFTSKEMALCIEAIKRNSTKQELDRINEILSKTNNNA